MTEKERQALDKKIEELEKKVSKVHVEYEAMLEELNDLLIQRYPERQEDAIKERLWNAYKKSNKDINFIIDFIENLSLYFQKLGLFHLSENTNK